MRAGGQPSPPTVEPRAGVPEELAATNDGEGWSDQGGSSTVVRTTPAPEGVGRLQGQRRGFRAEPASEGCVDRPRQPLCVLLMVPWYRPPRLSRAVQPTVQVRQGLFGARGPGSVERAAAAAVDEEPGPSHADRQDADVSTATSSSCVLTGMTPSGRTVRSTPPPTESSRSTTSSDSPSSTTPSARASVKTQRAPEQRRRAAEIR